MLWRNQLDKQFFQTITQKAYEDFNFQSATGENVIQESHLQIPTKAANLIL